MRRLVIAVSTAAVAAVSLVAAGLAGSGPATASGQDAGTRTHQVVVRPVDTTGHARDGWAVHRLTGFKVDCDGSAGAAVDDGIYACFPSAAYLPSCWPSRHHTMLCMRNPRVHKLVRVAYRGTLDPVTAPDRPTPQALDLATGQHCAVRVGGAWGTLPSHPDWAGFYSCRHGSVYGPANGDGVERGHQPWRVRVWRSGTRQDVVHRQVATAYAVGTHR